MRFFPSVSSHVYNQHVLGLEWLLLPATVGPATHKGFLVGLDMVLVDMLKDQTHGKACLQRILMNVKNVDRSTAKQALFTKNTHECGEC